MKFTNLIIKENGVLIDNGVNINSDDNNWLTLDKFLYLYYNTGRIIVYYDTTFFQYIIFNNDNKTFSFRYIGNDWNPTLGDHDVNVLYEVTFRTQEDFDKAQNIIESHKL